MLRLLSALGVAAALAAGSAALTPAVARPPHVIVRGATPILPPPAYVYGNGYSAYDWYDYTGLNGDPFAPYYDPSGHVPDTRYYGPKAVDLVLGRTLSRNNESMLRHMLVCQAAFPTYSAASNTYYGRNGISVPCYR
ncbi:MAG: hypothetical protein ABI377_01370 [Devosia sp.]